MDLTWIHVVILICSGLIVGFINTLAGGGTIISLSVFMFFGLPPVVANGTNRIPVMLQNITAVINFQRKKLIDWSKVLRLMLPIIAGALIGALFANAVSNTIFRYVFAVIALAVGISLIIKPDRWLKEKESIVHKPLTVVHYILFFFIGIYGGFMHVGVGYMILAGLVLGTGNELVKANAMKNMLVLAYIPFSLVIFALQGNVCWSYGLIHAIGNIIGAQIASQFAITKGGTLIRYIMIVLIIVVILQLLGIITPESASRLIN